ncbi:MAG: hypothetical protein EA351_12300 [Gemmatimonadales bacterium]|nr:MAG: hypothetical protein EA351_12300 [Gemmatimonadales bacterium]
MSKTRSRLVLAFKELRRRKVIRAAVLYLAAGMVVIEATDILGPRIGLADWAQNLMMLTVGLGFLPALVLAWKYDWTVEGIVRDPERDREGTFHLAIDAFPERELVPNSVAVLPFSSLMKGDDDIYFSEGITEEINAALCRIPELRVISRTSVARLKDHIVGIRDLGRRLGVELVVEGSVRRQNGRVRIHAQAVDVDSEASVWSEVYDRMVKDILEIQSDVAGRVAEALAMRLSPEMERRHRDERTDDPEAYDLYLKARYLWSHRTDDSMRQGLEHLERALELDPGFSLARAAMALTHATMGLYGIEAPDRSMGLALAEAQRTLELEPASSEALVARGCARVMYRWEWTAAEADFRSAIQLAPSYATAHQWLAMNLLAPRKRFDEAEEEVGHAAALDPISAAVGASQGVLAHFRRDHESALAHFDQVERLHPEFAAVHFFRGQALDAAGKPSEAISSFERAIEETGGTAEMIAGLGHALATAGRHRRARECLERLAARDGWVSPCLRAQVQTALGQNDAALDELETAADLHAPDLVWIGVRPTFDPIRTEPRFQELMRRIGLAPS